MCGKSKSKRSLTTASRKKWKARKSKPSRRHHGAQAKVVDIFAALKKSFETAERPAADMPYAQAMMPNAQMEKNPIANQKSELASDIAYLPSEAEIYANYRDGSRRALECVFSRQVS